MEENTPRFYQTIEEDKELESVFSFSVEYKKTSRTKSNSKRHSKRSSFHHHSNSKHKKSKTNEKYKNKLELPETSFNFHSNKELTLNCNIFTIHEFLNKNKFKLNNNFDRKNSKRFLSSKEEALEKPFFFDEIVDIRY